MSVAPTVTSKKGEVILQPSYFTSSIFVDALREDILGLIHAFTDAYLRTHNQSQPFLLFKQIWTTQGWPWYHLRILDERSRDKFLLVVARLFTEKTLPSEPPIGRITALFGLYTFWFCQPDTVAPKLHKRKQFTIPMDWYEELLELPNALLDPHLTPFRPHAIFILSKLLDHESFYILPHSNMQAQNPSVLPREVFEKDRTGAELLARLTATDPTVKVKRKVGRKTNREKALMAKDKIDTLSKWLDQTAFTYPQEERPPGATAQQVDGEAGPSSTHVLITHAPTASRNTYRTNKFLLLDVLNPVGPPVQGTLGEAAAEEELHAREVGRQALMKANAAVLARLRRIDELAAQKGLEVGGAGGDRTGLERVERAVREMGRVGFAGRRGGVLGLLEGGGMQLDPEEIEGNKQTEDADPMAMNVDAGPAII